MGKTKRKNQALATRLRIRDTALRLMKKYSIDEISVNEICEQAEVGVGTFYYYYKTKDNIILEAFQEMDIFFTELSVSKAAGTMSAYQYVLAHCRCYADFIMETGVEFTSKVYSMQSKTFLDSNRPFYVTLKRFLEQRQQLGLINSGLDILNFCQEITICIRGMGYDWCLRKGNYNFADGITAFMETFLVKYRPFLGH